MTVYRIPLSAGHQSLTVQLGDTEYVLSLVYRKSDDSAWILTISDTGKNVIVDGIPLVHGVDLLEQYRYLQIGGGGSLYIESDGQEIDPPTYDDLSNTTNLFWVPFT